MRVSDKGVVNGRIDRDILLGGELSEGELSEGEYI